MRVNGPICPMPERLPGSPRLRRGPDGKTVFNGFHDLAPIHDRSGRACRKCSSTWKWDETGTTLVPWR